MADLSLSSQSLNDLNGLTNRDRDRIKDNLSDNDTLFQNNNPINKSLTSHLKTSIPSFSPSPSPPPYSSLSSNTSTLTISPQSMSNLSIDEIINSLSSFLVHWKNIPYTQIMQNISNYSISRENDLQIILEQRKKLVEQTKAYKSQNNQEQLNSIGSLILAYQKHIDYLKHHYDLSSNFVSSIKDIITSIYSPLAILEICLTKIQYLQTFEQEHHQLVFHYHHIEQQLVDCETELSQLQNQDITIRLLTDENQQLKQEIQLQVQELLRDQIEPYKQSIINIQQQLNQKDKEFEIQIQQKKDIINQLQSLYDQSQSQLLSLSSTNNTNISNLSNTNLSSYVSEYERDREKAPNDVQILSNEIKSLQQEIIVLRKNKVELKENLIEFQKNNLQLIEKNQSLESRYSSLNNFCENEKLENQKLSQETKKISSKYSKLEQKYNEKCQKYEQLFHQSKTLSMPLTTVSTVPDSPKSSKSLSSLSICTQEIDEIKRKNQLLEREKKEIIKDLNNVTNQLNQKDQLFCQFDLSSLPESTLSSISPRQVPILELALHQCTQLKNQISFLQNEKSSLNSQITTLFSEKNQLKEDNISLYEKLQFVQDYQKQSLSPLSIGSDSTSHISKYQQLYEQQQNPFNIFKLKQKEHRIKNLSFPDRITFHFSRLCLNRTGLRSFIFFYALCLHLLAFVSIYSHTISPHC